MKVSLLLLLFINTAWAKDYKFKPDYWSRGLHLMWGVGPNVSHAFSDDNIDSIGYGINGKTDLGYYFTNRFALEWSSSVSFTSIEDYFTWNTLLTLGIRYRIKEYFVRAFYGRSPTVVFFQGKKPEGFEESSASRLQYDGPVVGLSLGKMFQHKDGLIWFLEATGTFQNLSEREAIKMDGQTPVVVDRSYDTSSVSSLFFNIGIMVF